VLDVTLGSNNIAVLGKLAKSGEQWEVSNAQWSDLRGDYTIGFGYRGCNWSNYEHHSVGQCSASLAAY